MAILPDLEPPSSKRTSKSKNRINQIAIKFSRLTQSLSSLWTKLVFFVGQIREIPNIIGNFYKKNARFLPHFAIVFLVLVVAISNVAEGTRAKAITSDLVSPNPDEEFAVATNVDIYTPLIENDPIMLDKYILAQINYDGFSQNIAPVSTRLTARIEPLPDNSREAVSYIVKSGDSLSKIAGDFGVKLTFVKYLNDMSNDVIRPGVKIKIPSKTYSVSSAEIAKKEQSKEVKLAITSRNTVARATTRSNYGGSYQGETSVSLTAPLPYYKYISRGVSRSHNGIDYATSIGTPVIASANGVIMATSSGWSGGYGNQIVVSHGNGVATRYAHLSSVKVSSGQTVSQGQVIGYSGNSGNSTGPHLHFEEIVNGHTVNPF